MAFQEDYQQNPPSISVFGRSYVGNRDAVTGGSGIFYHAIGDNHGVKVIPYIKALGQFGKAKEEATLESHIATFAQRLYPEHIIGVDDTTEISLPNGQEALAMLMRYGGNTARNNYRLTNEERLTICRDAAQALTILHQNNIMHGDISPENIVYNQNRNGIQAAVTDFGEARIIGTNNDFPGGSHRYTDPERAHGIIGYTNDIYSFSVVAQELLYHYLASQQKFGFGVLLKNELNAAKGPLNNRPTMTNLNILLRDTLAAEKALQTRAA